MKPITILLFPKWPGSMASHAIKMKEQNRRPCICYLPRSWMRRLGGYLMLTNACGLALLFIKPGIIEKQCITHLPQFNGKLTRQSMANVLFLAVTTPLACVIKGWAITIL